MGISTASSYLDALEKARMYTPDAKLSREIVLKLAQKGLCISTNAPSWLKVKCPTAKTVFQMELGKPGEENTLAVTALNEKIPAQNIFPLYSLADDQIILPLISEYYTLDDVVDEIITFIVEHEPEAEPLLAATVPPRRSTKR